MVVRMLRWPTWSSRKFEVKVIIQKLKVLNFAKVDTNCESGNDNSEVNNKRFVVEVKWKGQKGIALRGLKRSVKRNCTEESGFSGDGVFEWNEDFTSVCNFSGYKDGAFSPWEIAFTVFDCITQGPGSKILIVGTATLNLAKYASTSEKELQIDVPLVVPSSAFDGTPLLGICLRLVELRTAQESPQAVESSLQAVSLSPSPVLARSLQKDDFSGCGTGLRMLPIFREAKKASQEDESSDGRSYGKSKDAYDNSPFDTDSFGGDTEGETEDNNVDANTQLSKSNETLAYTHFTGGSLYLKTVTSNEDESWVYYNHWKPDVGYSKETVPEQSPVHSPKNLFLPWTRRKFRFRYNKHKAKKGEPLLKKDYREDGGDDIDYDRRQLSSSEESSFAWNKSEEGSTTTRSSFSEFGDDNFAVGSWELREVTSRDGHLKLQAQVFFASIDQRSERAAGESACTALVAVIANWLQTNRDELPIKSEFDSLIRDGSSEWRNLCENEEYMQRFPDKHFDLETVIQAKIRPLTVVSEKSFIGFFHLEGLEGEDFDFLHGAMSFHDIWEHIGRYESEGPNNNEQVYIVSWNDHFFILNVEQDAYYIIDTLGERLYEGCNQAYVLKFDKDTTIKRHPKETKESAEGTQMPKTKASEETPAKEEAEKSDMLEEIVCKGKESCKEYIKSFLAAIPLRELQADIKKGLKGSTPIHQRLQIEFHYTKMTPPPIEYSPQDTTSSHPPPGLELDVVA